MICGKYREKNKDEYVLEIPKQSFFYIYTHFSIIFSNDLFMPRIRGGEKKQLPSFPTEKIKKLLVSFAHNKQVLSFTTTIVLMMNCSLCQLRTHYFLTITQSLF